MNAAGLPLLLALTVAGGTPGADEHLLAGAHHFRDGRFDAALVEFRVAQKLGAEDAAVYAAASLVKLGRTEEALEAFAAAPEAGGSAGADSLFDYYRALACYGARLYACADRRLAEVGDRAGPKIAVESAKLRAAIARVLAAQPAPASIDWYLARCAELRSARRFALAAAYCREAADLAARRKDRHGLAQANAELSRLAPVPASGDRP